MESSNGASAEPTAGQKALRGWRLWKNAGLSKEDAAERAGTSPRQIEAVGSVLNREPDMAAGLESGDVTLNAALTAAGFRQHKPIGGRAYGKGDKWPQVMNPLMQFLAGWKTRDYKFTHVPPREAEARVKVIDDMIEGLQAVRADLAQRSVRATSSLPSR